MELKEVRDVPEREGTFRNPLHGVESMTITWARGCVTRRGIHCMELKAAPQHHRPLVRVDLGIHCMELKVDVTLVPWVTAHLLNLVHRESIAWS